MTPIAAPSPNFDRRQRSPDMIVLHYTGMPTGATALARLRDPAAKVSAHWLVEEDGRLFTLVDERYRAWHAGAAFWAGELDINGLSVGVEIVNPGHEFGYREFPEAQVNAVIDLLGAIRHRWAIPDSRILGHSDVAPGRKRDPGERFPWARLAAAGHGIWPVADPGGAAADRGGTVEIAKIQNDLAALGYDARPTGRMDEATATIVRAFQRHWAPERVDGRVDERLRRRLAAVREVMRPRIASMPGAPPAKSQWNTEGGARR